jgi:RNA recognition motif-containing protein
MNKSTGQPKGTAFVDFKAPAGAAAAAAACARARAGKGPELQIKGRPIEVDAALDQDGARSLAVAHAVAKGAPGYAGGAAGGAAGKGAKGADRRNLYLAKEGAIEEGSAAWQGMSDYDKWALVFGGRGLGRGGGAGGGGVGRWGFLLPGLARLEPTRHTPASRRPPAPPPRPRPPPPRRSKRKRAAEEKNIKLKSPNFAVSPLRLSVRNLPAGVDEKRLKALFVEAVKARATKERPTVKQVKILRDQDRPDPKGDARGKSKGIGFVEFDRHDHALAALRQLNNNPATFGAERRPIVEFAIENVKVRRQQGEGGSGREAFQLGRWGFEGSGEAGGVTAQPLPCRVARSAPAPAPAPARAPALTKPDPCWHLSTGAGSPTCPPHRRS